jgi:hypothetical protein
MIAPVQHPYQLIGVRGGQLATLRSFWAADDNDARAQVGEIPSGVVLIREVERASPGKGGKL